MVRLILRRGVVLAMAMALAMGSASLTLAESPPPTGGPTVAGDDLIDATEDQVLEVPAPGLLANDNYGLDTCVVLDTDFPGLVGAVVLHTDGSFEYTPPANFNGVTSFIYGIRIVGDDQCTGPADSEGIVTITVASVNDAPTATADSFIVLKDRTLNVGVPGVLINDHDVDGDTLQALLDVNVSHGTLVLALNGAFAYTPATGYTGPDVFSYEAFDGSLSSPPRVVKLTVTAIPPVPTPTPPPTPTPAPTPTPTLEPSPSPEASPSPETSPSAEPSSSASLEPSVAPSPTPAASPEPAPTSGNGGISLPVLLMIVLLLLLLGFGAAVYLPKWLAARGREPFDP